jgi:hypothetical protein
MGRVVEQTSGDGEVYEGTQRLGRATYSIRVYQETQTVRTFGENVQQVDGIGRITGIVNPESPLSIFDLITRNAMLTLHLEDGRRWEFAFKNSDGDAVNTNGKLGLYKPEAA